jgi:hypothetical protein
MNKTTISYSELSDKYVRNAVLFNNLPGVDENWMCGFIVSPLLQQKIEQDDGELAKDHGISVEELGEHSEVPEPTSVYDYAESIYQTYMIDGMSALDLYNHTSEIISYSEKLDAFFWHVCHYGTFWGGVHTEVTNDLPDNEQVRDVERLANLVQG